MQSLRGRLIVLVALLCVAHGMKRLKLRAGSNVVARGERRKTVIGTTLIEAHAVNRVSIE